MYADTRMAPAGVRAIGSAMADVGFHKTRIVLQQWNRNFRPSLMQLDGRIPDVFMVSTMGMHPEQAKAMMLDARRIDACLPAADYRRRLSCGVRAGLSFQRQSNALRRRGCRRHRRGICFAQPARSRAVHARGGETMRSAFLRAEIAEPWTKSPGWSTPAAIATALPRNWLTREFSGLLGELDELPDPVLGYRLLEKPSSSSKLATGAMPANKVELVQPDQLAGDDLRLQIRLHLLPDPRLQPAAASPQKRRAHRRWICGGCTRSTACGISSAWTIIFSITKRARWRSSKTLASAEFEGVAVRSKARWYTEVTVHDTLQMKEHLPLVRKAGCRALWLGVEDMTATLVKKGQSVDKTTEAFHLMRNAGICPMPMMMHHDSQPLYSPGTNYGLLNQVRLLRKAGAVSLQVLMMTPSPGTKLFEQTFETRQVLGRVGGRRAEPYMYDGNYVVASTHRRPWRKQLNMLVAYIYFYNPWWLTMNLLHRKTKLGMKPAGMQLIGMFGLFHTIRRTLGWAMRLMFGKIERLTRRPRSPIPLTGVHGTTASHSGAEPEVSASRGRTIPLLIAS